MGAWTFVQPYLRDLLPPGVGLRYIGRPEAASPAEGSASLHAQEQNRIITAAFAAQDGAEAEIVGAPAAASDAAARPRAGKKTTKAALGAADASEVTHAR